MIKIYSIAIEFDSTQVECFKVKHDAAEPVNFCIRDGEEKILYVTDCGQFNYKFDSLTKILIETNFSEEDLKNSSTDFSQKKRIFENHLSIEKVEKYLSEVDLSKCKEIYLIHISGRHGDGEEFKNRIQKVVGDEIKVIVAKNKECF